MATKRDLEEINRQYPSGPDGPKADWVSKPISRDDCPYCDISPFGEREEPTHEWPAREPYEEDHRYLIRMVRQLFLEIEALKAELVASQDSERP